MWPAVHVSSCFDHAAAGLSARLTTDVLQPRVCWDARPNERRQIYCAHTIDIALSTFYSLELVGG